MSDYKDDSVKCVADLAKTYLQEILAKQEKDIVDYMNEYMTHEEIQRHGDNIWNMIAKTSSSLAFFKLKLMTTGINFK